MQLIDLLRNRLLGGFQTPGINPNAPPTGVPPQASPQGMQGRIMQGIESPLGQIGLQMLANSRDARGNPVSLGQSAGNAVLGYQQQQRDIADNDLRKQYMQAQIKQMGLPDPAQVHAPVMVTGPDGNPVYVSREEAIGKQPYVAPPNSNSDPREIAIARALNDPNTPDAVKKDLRQLMDRMYRDNAGEPLVAIQTPDGRTVLVPRSQAVGATPAATRENPSGEERAAANYYGRMEAAEKLLGNFKPTLMQSIAAEKWMEGGSATSAVANSMLGEQGGSFYQAAADWVRAKLRKESGAVISPEEMVQEIRTYFPQPGDSAARIEQKRQARLQAMSGMKDMSGRAAPSTAPPGGNAEDPLGLR